jgi:hypothetical protein
MPAQVGTPARGSLLPPLMVQQEEKLPEEARIQTARAYNPY